MKTYGISKRFTTSMASGYEFHYYFTYLNTFNYLDGVCWILFYSRNI